MTEPAAEPDLAIEQITAFINYVSRLATSSGVRRRVAEAAARTVTQSELDALRAVGGNGPMTFTALAEALQLDRTTISRTAGRLLELGLLRRESDADDRRKAWLEVTDAGASIVDRYQNVSKQWYEVATSEWSERDRTHLGALLHRLQDCLVRLEFDDHGRAVGLGTTPPPERRGGETSRSTARRRRAQPNA